MGGRCGGGVDECVLRVCVGVAFGFSNPEIQNGFRIRKGGEKKRTGLDSNMHNKHTTEVYNGEPKRSRETSKKKEKRVP